MDSPESDLFFDEEGSKLALAEGNELGSIRLLRIAPCFGSAVLMTLLDTIFPLSSQYIQKVSLSPTSWDSPIQRPLRSFVFGVFSSVRKYIGSQNW